MTRRRRQQHEIDVHVKWIRSRTTEDGRTYAHLRWRETDPDGTTRRMTHPLGYVTEDEASEARSRQEASLRLGLEQPDSAPGYGVGDLLADYIESVDHSPTTAAHKDRVVVDCDAIARHLGGLQADALTAHHARQYVAMRSRERVVRARRRKAETDAEWERRAGQARVAEDGKPVSSTTIRHELATLRRAMRWGRDAGRVRAEPIPMPHRKSLAEDARPPRRLTEAEVQALIAAAGEYGGLIEVLAWSGRRPVAIFAQQLADLERLVTPGLERQQRLAYWRRDKGGVGRGWGPLAEPAYRALRRRALELQGQPPDTLVWSTPTGRPWASTHWPKVFRRIADQAGIADVTTYDLRKHACAQILRATGNPASAIRYTGHRTVEMFLRVYAYALEGDAEAAAERIGWTPRKLQLVHNEED